MNTALKTKTTHQVVKYLLATAFSGCFTLLLPVALHEGFSVREEHAVGLSLVAAFFVNFLTTRYFVFQSRGGKRKEIALFLVTSLFFRGFEFVLFLGLFSLFSLHYIVALVMVLAMSLVFKFTAYKHIVFRSPAETAVPLDNLDDVNRTYHIVQDHMRLLPNYYRWTYGSAKKHIRGTVVELGCGAGFGIGSYLDSVDKVYAVDHSQDLLDEVSKAYPGGRVETVLADLQADWTTLDFIKADTVILMDVLEHFKDDRLFLQKAAGLLKPGGNIVVKVPANRKLYGNIDVASGHYRRYDRADLEALGRGIGLTPVRIGLINMPGFLMYGLKKHKNSNFSKTFSSGQLWMINRAIPVIKLADGTLRALTGGLYKGLSVIAVFEA